MKKKLVIAILVILLIIVIVILSKKNITKSKTEYEIPNIESYTYVKYMEKEKYGIINNEGNIVIEAQYSNIEIPNPQKAVFICYDENQKTTVLNEKKEALFDKYDKVEPIKLKNVASVLSYEKSVLRYQKNDNYGLIDFTGRELTKNEYSSIENLQGTEGKFLVSKSGKYGVINVNGELLVEAKYDKIATDNYYNEKTKYVEAGFIVSNTTNDGYRYGYIDYQGHLLLDVEYNEIVRINEQNKIYLIVSKNGKYGLYQEGKQLIKPEYQSISYTDNGAVVVEKNKQYGIANLKGEIKSDIKYSEVEGRGIYIYAQNDRENDVYDVNGNKIEINFNKTVYPTESENYNITTLINNNVTYYGIESKEGIALVDLGYSYIEYAFKNYFIAEDENGKYGVLNANGKKELDFEYDVIQKLKGKNILQAQKKKSKKIEYYSINLDQVVSMDSARLEEKNNYVKVYNNNETVFLDKDGNEIEKTSQIIQKELKSELPNEIGEYQKVLESLENIYYTKLN